MKKLNLNKLSLNKETIARLNADQTQNVLGGKTAPGGGTVVIDIPGVEGGDRSCCVGTCNNGSKTCPVTMTCQCNSYTCQC